MHAVLKVLFSYWVGGITRVEVPVGRAETSIEEVFLVINYSLLLAKDSQGCQFCFPG